MIDWLASNLKAQWVQDLTVRYDMFQPTAETLHFFGLALLVGTIGLLDLRLLGLGKGISVAALHRLVPWGIGGFVLCIITGWIFIAGDPFRQPGWYLRNIAFQIKMVCVAFAGINALAFYVTGLAKRIEKMGPNDTAPMGAKVIAGISIALWIAVIYFGRMLPWQDALYMIFEDPADWTT